LKLIVGLGNPGARYRGTLHNVGFDVVDALATRHAVRFDSSPVDALVARIRGFGDGVLLAKPLTFMNLSGPAVGDLQRYFRIELADTLVIVDDVNLAAGQLRIRGEGSAGGHNGLKSLIAALGTDGFPRLRLGVGRGDPRRGLADHVLAKIDPAVQDTVAEAIARAADAAECFVTGTLGDVMNRFNTRPASAEKAPQEKSEADKPPAEKPPADKRVEKPGTDGTGADRKSDDEIRGREEPDAR
jgi:PTH1 family peptidyl-tRNA hydrolase